ncbi:alanyl-tRNA editing protein Aarsd1-like [Teleopsis dalmanni]|uniref:alanyl-tRNA editing protein Aarsd1-like n=1 Tax=Teleopsis dalmanni TaxID=139649 RepID=UPI0018CEC8CE|nr:alanyl-tRNA editing protein Aarsd1-like [Teleopsis dalmanni]
MPFRFQKDILLREFETTVLSCEKATRDLTPSDDEYDEDDDEDAEIVDGYDVVCEDTILYPAASGQPCDLGTMNGEPVRYVTRTEDGLLPLHFVETSQPFEEGSRVKLVLDWDRRFDSMQQHTGQHFLTALFEIDFHYVTKAWLMTSETSYIVMPGAQLINRAKLDIIERMANQIIREGRKVSVETINATELHNFQENIAPSGQTIDENALTRLVRIEGIPSVVCCGTHVTNLSQLQCVKLLSVEGFRGSWVINYVIGRRVVRKLAESVERERLLKLSLGGEPEQHLKLLEQLQRKFKIARKALEKALRDFALVEAKKVENLQPRPQFYCLHRSYGIEPVFINEFLDEAPEDILYFVTVSQNVESGGKGFMVLRGETELMERFGTTFFDILTGEGKVEGNSFQGLFYNIDRIPECDALLEQHFNMTE